MTSSVQPLFPKYMLMANTPSLVVLEDVPSKRIHAARKLGVPLMNPISTLGVPEIRRALAPVVRWARCPLLPVPA